ncbi:MAG: trigger factor [Clostridia bacterium]|nr:trigger factor [Clostridia bacterium]
MYKLTRENTKIDVDVTVDSKELEEMLEHIYQETKSKYNVIGFRKGHAPRKMIEKQYGDNVFFDDAIEHFMEHTMNEILPEYPQYEPVARPTTQLLSYTRDGELKFRITFHVVPEFEICKYKGAEIKVHKSPEITEEQINHHIRHLLEEGVTYNSVDRPAQNGDSVVVDYAGYLDGVAFEGGTSTDAVIELGAKRYIPGFEEAIVGHKKGDEFDIVTTFPKDYFAAELAGKQVVFKSTLKDVREKHLPELTDKFVSDTTEFETVDEYRKSIIAHIQDMNEKSLENEIQVNGRNYLVDNTKIEIPDIMVDNHLMYSIQNMHEALQQYNMTLDQYLASINQTAEEYVSHLREDTLKQIKARYIYRKIIADNNITVDAKELKEATKGMTDAREIKMKENDLLFDKLQAFLKSNYKIVFVDED